MSTPTDQIEIVQINSENQGCLAVVAPDVFDADIIPARLAAYLDQPNHLMWVAIKDGEVVGQVLGVIHHHPDKPTELYIDDLGVSPRCFRQGIATTMVKALIQSGKEIGCEEVWVATEPDNEIAKAFYLSLGLVSSPSFVIESKI